ncbi:hypothetical protein GW915_00360 [bacterium]|nr:hypothetical protein [bacterium]
MSPNNITPHNCSKCGKQFFKKASESAAYWEIKRFCSRKCKTDAARDKPTWNKGVAVDRAKYPNMGHMAKHSAEALEKIAVANRRNAKKHDRDFYVRNQELAIASGLVRGSYKNNGAGAKEKNGMWLGDGAAYNSIHRWIQANWKKIGICSKCGGRPRPFGIRRWGTEWHNVDGEYDRNRPETWVEVCKRCHNLLDKNGRNNN